MKLCERVDEANRRLPESYSYWKQTRVGVLPTYALERHVYANEQAGYLLRRAADDLIALIGCLSECEEKGTYPRQISVDCIRAVVKQSVERQLPFCKNHIEVLNALNEIANAFKHSFVHSDITVVGRDGPRVHALSLEHNKIVSGVRFHDVSLDWLVERFSAFYQQE